MIKRAVYFDVHGVLLDFISAIEARFKQAVPSDLSQIHPGNFHSCFNVHDSDADAFWGSLDVRFWSSLPLLSNGYDAWLQMRANCALYEIPLFILTRPTRQCLGACVEGTMQALQNLGIEPERVVIAYNKTACVPGILVDDDPANVASWRAGGGEGFLWPSRSNNFTGRQHNDFNFNNLLYSLSSWNRRLI